MTAISILLHYVVQLPTSISFRPVLNNLSFSVVLLNLCIDNYSERKPAKLFAVGEKSRRTIGLRKASFFR